MAMNFIGCDRNQVFLMPPLLNEWLPDDHLCGRCLTLLARWISVRSIADQRQLHVLGQREPRRLGLGRSGLDQM